MHNFPQGFSKDAIPIGISRVSEHSEIPSGERKASFEVYGPEARSSKSEGNCFPFPLEKRMGIGEVKLDSPLKKKKKATSKTGENKRLACVTFTISSPFGGGRGGPRGREWMCHAVSSLIKLTTKISILELTCL